LLIFVVFIGFLYFVGNKLQANRSDRIAHRNLIALSRGIVLQVKKLQSMIQKDPDPIDKKKT